MPLAMRYNRIDVLMNNMKTYTMADFFNFAHDQDAGNWNSIFKVGKNPTDPGTPRTVATFIASIPKNGDAPTVSIQFYPAAKITESVYTYTLNTSFWNFQGAKKVLAIEPQIIQYT